MRHRPALAFVPCKLLCLATADDAMLIFATFGIALAQNWLRMYILLSCGAANWQISGIGWILHDSVEAEERAKLGNADYMRCWGTKCVEKRIILLPRLNVRSKWITDERIQNFRIYFLAGLSDSTIVNLSTFFKRIFLFMAHDWKIN